MVTCHEWPISGVAPAGFSASACTGGHDVILDWLLNRTPWSVDARPLWLAHANQQVIAYVSASAVTGMFYIARRARDIPTAFACVDQLLAAFKVVAVDGALLRAARALPGNDFEDNVQIACAQAVGLDVIVTRDPTGFAHASMPAIAPPDITRYLP